MTGEDQQPFNFQPDANGSGRDSLVLENHPNRILSGLIATWPSYTSVYSVQDWIWT